MVVSAVVLSACTAGVPDDLARAVLVHELPSIDGIANEGFLACVAVESHDVDTETLAALRAVHVEAVPASECQWVMDGRGSYHRASKRKAMLVNVFGYERAGTIELEARHHGKYATMRTLKVAHESSGWKVVRTLQETMAKAEQSHAGDVRNARA